MTTKNKASATKASKTKTTKKVSKKAAVVVTPTPSSETKQQQPVKKAKQVPILIQIKGKMEEGTSLTKLKKLLREAIDVGYNVGTKENQTTLSKMVLGALTITVVEPFTEKDVNSGASQY